MVPRVEPVSRQVKVAPMPPLVDWPVPMPVVVQPAIATAARDAAAVLIANEVMTILLFAPENAKRPVSAPTPVRAEDDKATGHYDSSTKPWLNEPTATSCVWGRFSA